jgi:hypothetical protein
MHDARRDTLRSVHRLYDLILWFTPVRTTSVRTAAMCAETLAVAVDNDFASPGSDNSEISCQGPAVSPVRGG